jgi:deoxyribose-phosphate aldolase
VAATRAAIGDDVGLKAILETGSLGDADTIRDAAERALGAGAGFLKTSTGKVGAGASLEATRVLLEVVRDAGHGGVKASGGVRSAEQAAEYLALADEVMGAGWATPERFRIGASSLVDDLLARLGDQDAP